MNQAFFSPSIVLFALAVVVCWEQSSAQGPPSNVKTDEDILFFPTYGRYDQQAGVWKFNIHGKVFEPEYSSIKRAALIAVLRSSVDFGVGVDGGPILDERIRPFLVDNERGKSVTIQVAGEQFTAGTSQPSGHFSKSLALDVDSLRPTDGKNRIQEVEALLSGGDLRSFTGRVHLIAPQGVSVISDIDDTIKHSQVTDKSALLQNTFLRPFRAVEGMPKLYTRLAHADVAFHFVSGSPWQLYQPLDAFMFDAGFPKGTFHLKQFRLKDSSAIELLSSQQETKFAAITPLLNAFPNRDFVLIGDSGEQDPEIYGRIARDHPDQIVGIFIRNVTGEDRDDERFSAAFANVPGNRWALFDKVTQVSDQIVNCAKAEP